MAWAVLSSEFFDRDVVCVARELLGKRLYRRSREGLTSGLIVESEAYLATGDSAAHSFHGKNRKNATMFGAAGRSYVYTIHARQCFNVVAQRRSAVLIRAVEPDRGLDLMAKRRGVERKEDLCRGPARLCEAFDIGREFDGWNLLSGRRLWLEGPTCAAERSAILVSTRIGVTSAEERLLRFHLGGHFVSGTKRLNSTGSMKA